MCRVATKSLVQISKASCAIRARADGKLRYFSVPSGQYICHLIRSSSQMSSSTKSHLSIPQVSGSNPEGHHTEGRTIWRTIWQISGSSSAP